MTSLVFGMARAFSVMYPFARSRPSRRRDRRWAEVTRTEAGTIGVVLDRKMMSAIATRAAAVTPRRQPIQKETAAPTTAATTARPIQTGIRGSAAMPA